jgi:hypothetical protein
MNAPASTFAPLVLHLVAARQPIDFAERLHGLSPGRPAQLRLIELREKARQAPLGERFSLKNFHNAVLTAGTLPIDMLEREVDTYIQSAARR